ncbi:Poly(ADP-ribose) glycohydrolase-like Protein [Tribolium castaneum]|uniref:poly(ADP-ribose) glycohydrolase n=1 Tax=Tribolium castaneum TaxID=7070 RepID=D6W990_TRICA|nr:PREDICTED: poly(ADP-ribose) glycohydrolase [Tribolium castaneum]EEZ98465.1 Poly(ADP-ribose) glycohydrolase-like Protein [Tribolium castaneum]|eukprot:XP_967400.1 PREDICTED: poly(ADP-ribose) glycohydrolase [Tribolium castaneum]
MSDSESQTWLGTPLSDMYKGQGPWGFATAPVTPAKYHHVLFELPVTLKEPPEPHYNAQPKHWDDDYVRMPYSSHSLFLVKENGEEVIKPRWDVINEALSKPITSVEDLEKAINTYNNKLPKFTALKHFFNDVIEEEEAQLFFTSLLPKIIKLALRLPELVPGSIPLLRKNHSKSVSLSQLQVASLIANAFLCTLIWRKKTSDTFPGVNFTKLFNADDRTLRQECVAEKLKCIMHYFNRVTTKTPVGVITFERKFVPRSQMPRWDALDNNLGNTKVHISSSGTIEEARGFLQVDFANKFIGGGVLSYGCVQEEIRFVICPELIISRLFTEVLGDGEAVIITGIERYSNYSGYSNTFKWDGNVNDDTPFDDFGRRKTTLAVIDATQFTKSKDQFHCSTILRELNKAYVGFSCREKQNLAPVATGNWGCGAFKGDPNLKSLIQLMACSASGRDLVYYSFGDVELRDEFYKMYMFLANNKITICQLWRYLCRFCGANVTPDKLYSFIQQCHFDSKTQPTIKQFFGLTQKRKPDLNLPSTSAEDAVKTKKTSPNERKVKDEAKPSVAKYPELPVTIERKKSPVTPDEIIEIIDIIDGNVAKSRDNAEQEEESLLSKIDKMKKSETKKSDDCEIPMEVDVEPKPVGFIEDKKRKISDYFSKVTNHVNSYL